MLQEKKAYIFLYTSKSCSLLSSDIDECSNGQAVCDANALCTNTDGGYTCTCKDGYDGDGQNCRGKQKRID